MTIEKMLPRFMKINSRLLISRCRVYRVISLIIRRNGRTDTSCVAEILRSVLIIGLRNKHRACYRYLHSRRFHLNSLIYEITRTSVPIFAFSVLKTLKRLAIANESSTRWSERRRSEGKGEEIGGCEIERGQRRNGERVVARDIRRPDEEKERRYGKLRRLYNAKYKKRACNRRA